MSDPDGYPTATELERVREWPADDVHGLLDYIHSIWWQPNWGWTEFAGRDGDEPTRVILASTAGWSGNESIMEAFRENWLAYHRAFESYRRGGHYQLALPARDYGQGTSLKDGGVEQGGGT